MSTPSMVMKFSVSSLVPLTGRKTSSYPKQRQNLFLFSDVDGDIFILFAVRFGIPEDDQSFFNSIAMCVRHRTAYLGSLVVD